MSDPLGRLRFTAMTDSVNTTSFTSGSSAQAAGSRLGERLRSRRVTARQTPTERAGAPLSKGYVSQIERG